MRRALPGRFTLGPVDMRKGTTVLKPCTRIGRVRAFTLVELLVVIGIIALLISILLPALGKVREQGMAVTCQSNMRTLMAGILMFAQDHKNSLPGNKSDGFVGGPTGNADPEKRDFLGVGPSGANLANTPEAGTLFKYVKKKEVYLCPKMVADGYGTGVGSGTNGHFDYAIFQSLPGAKLNNLKHAWYKTTTGQQLNVPTFPVLVQENAISFNGGVNQEGGHSNRGSHFVVPPDYR